MERKQIAILALVLLVQLFLIGYFVSYRIVDRDEGLYLFLAREVSQGKTPYADFFFPQMPLVLYLFAPISRLGWEALFVARSVYGAMSLGLGLLIFWSLCRWGYGFGAAISALSIYALNGFILSWHTVVQFNAMTDLLVFTAFLSLVAGMEGRRGVHYLGAGFLLGLAVSLRVVFIPVLLLFLFLIYFFDRRHGFRVVVQRLILCSFGALLGGSALVYYLVRIRVPFLQQTILFQLFRQRFFSELSGGWPLTKHNLVTLAKFFLFPQTGLVVLLSVVALLVYRRGLPREGSFIRSRPREGMLLLIALTVFFSHLLVTPFLFHYFVQILPPLICFLGPSLPTLASTGRLRRLCGAVALLYLGSILIPVGLHVSAWMPKYRPWHVDNLRRVVEKVRGITSKDEQLISYWPGFLVLSQRRGVQGVSPWDRTITDRLTEDEARNYGLTSSRIMREAILGEKAALVIAPSGLRDESLRWIEEAYREAEEFQGFVIYMPKGAAR